MQFYQNCVKIINIFSEKDNERQRIKAIKNLKEI